MTQYAIDIPKCRASVLELDRLSKEIDRDLTALEQDTEKKLAEWEGSAQLAYRTCKAEWDRSAREMATQLVTVRTALEEIITNIEIAERNGEEAFATQTRARR
jgi:WXG100 family type VII secretion target